MPTMNDRINAIQAYIDNTPLIKLLSSVGFFVTNLAVFFAVVFYLLGYADRQRSSHFQDWQIVNSAKGGLADGSRREALKDLAENWQDLDRVDLSGVYLKGTWLRAAKLSRANFSGADLTSVDFSCRWGVRFIYKVIPYIDSCKYSTDLTNADFRNAIINHTDFEGALINFGIFLHQKMQPIGAYRAISHSNFNLSRVVETEFGTAEFRIRTSIRRFWPL